MVLLWYKFKKMKNNIGMYDEFVQDYITQQVANRIAREKKEFLDKEIYLTKEEVAVMFGVSVSTIDRLRNDKLLPFIKIGRSVRFSLEKLKNALIL